METEQSLKQVMQHLLARVGEIKAREEAHQESMQAFLEGLMSGKKETACLVECEASPEESTAGPQETEAGIFTFKEHSDRIEAADLEATLEEMEVTVKWHNSLMKKLKWTLSCHWRIYM
jgi:hypothetical protein